MVLSRKSRRGKVETYNKAARADDNPLKVCRLCLKSIDKDAVSVALVYKIIQAIKVPSTVANPPASDSICQECSDQLQSFWSLRKKILFSDLIWQNYTNRLKDCTSPDDQLELYCHLCSTPFRCQDLQDHIQNTHAQDHLKSCKLCQSLVEFPIEPSEAEDSSGAVSECNDDNEDEPEKIEIVPVSRKRTKRQSPQKIVKKESSSPPSTATRHVCRECDKSFTRRDKLKLHLLQKHDIVGDLPRNTSKTNQNQINTSSDSVKLPVRSITCRECSKVFESGEQLEDHLKSFHDIVEILYELPICTLNNTVDSPNQKPFACHMCNNVSYAKRDKLVVHLRQKHKIVLKRKPEQNVCHICEKALSCPKSLRRHLRMTHQIDDTEEKKRNRQQFICPHCGKTFSAMISFDAHLQEHSALPFRCTICEVFSFRTRGDRKEHELLCLAVSSTSSVKYHCLSCGPKSDPLESVDRLKSHQKAVHLDGSGGSDRLEMRIGFNCTICLEKIPGDNMAQLLKHLDQHGQVTCRVCNKTYPDTVRLKSHFVKSHSTTASLVCTECGQVLSRPDKLIEHMWTHTGFACSICKRVFKKRKEFQQHRREVHGKGGTQLRVAEGDVEIQVEDIVEEEEDTIEVMIIEDEEDFA